MTSLCIGALPPPMASAVRVPCLSFSKSQSLVYASPSLSISTGVRLPSPPIIYCGRGDKKTARGKRFKHSYGNARPRNKTKGRGPPRVPAPPLPPRKDKYDDGTVVRIEIDESLLN